MKKKNILFVLHTLPWPLNLGGNQAMFNGVIALRGLANIYVTFPLNEKDEKYDKLKKEFGNDITVLPYINKIDQTFAQKIINVLRKVKNVLFKPKFSKKKYLDTVLMFPKLSTDETDFILSVINEKHIDIVQVEMLGHISLVNNLPQNVKKIFVHHEIGFIVKEQLINEYGGDSYYKLKLEEYRKEEIKLLNRYDTIIVLSNIDKLKLQQSGVKVPIHTSFAIVKQSNDYSPVFDAHYNLCFVGTSKHRPNYIGLLWFLDNCWNNLLKIDSRYNLKVISYWDEKYIDSIQSKYENIKFAGYVDDIGKELRNSIMIVPITVGSGIRMKILEAANHGIPVVSTSIGAEGLPLINGENAFISDDPNSFIESILKLQDENLKKKFVDSLHTIIRENYSLEALIDNRKFVLNL